jgi:type IX secretion system substrate protein/metallopeptidase family M12-like protein
MKRQLLLSLLFFGIFCNGQALRPIAAEIQKRETSHSVFTAYRPLSKYTDDAAPKYTASLSAYTAAKCDPIILSKILAEKPENLTFIFPFLNENITVTLYRTDISNGDFIVNTDKGYYSGYKKGVYYRGIISGDNRSLAAISFFESGIYGVVSSLEKGDINIGKIKGSVDDYIIYSTQHLLKDQNLQCHMRDITAPGDQALDNNNVSRNSLATNTTKCVRMYYELVYGVYTANESDLDLSLDWLTSIHNNVTAAYANDGITNIPISEVFIWTTPEPYQPGTYGYLEDFEKYRTAFNGDIANLILASGPGGWGNIGLLCEAVHNGGYTGGGPYEACGADYVIEDFPVYSATIKSISHEIGHVLGSRHTHNCAWNGNNTQIDDCGNQFGGFEPAWCYNEASPIIPPFMEGTIMSYCGGALAAGFGPQPSQLMINNIENAGCLGTDCSTSCTPTIEGITLSEITTTGAKLTIHDSNPNAASWKLDVHPYGSPAGYITINQNPYFITGLSPKSVYDVDVQQICDAPMSANFMSTFPLYTGGVYCDEIFYDYGGEFNVGIVSYETTLFPSNVNEKVSIQLYYAKAAEGDTIYIHDGPDTSYPVLAEYIGYNYNLPSFTSTDATGTLTFHYAANFDNNTAQGWAGLVSCAVPLGLEGNTPDKVRFYPNPVTDFFYIENAESISAVKVVDMIGRIVSLKNSNSGNVTIDFRDFSQGQYVVILDSGKGNRIIKVVKN